VDKIAKLQKKAIRIVTKSHYLAHTQPLFASLEILPLDATITKARLLFMHSVFHGYASPAFLGHWTRNADRDMPYELRNEQDFALPRIKYSCLKRLPFYSFAECWNNATDNKYIQNPYTFKIALKLDLLSPSPTIPTPPGPLPIAPPPIPPFLPNS
jgi:hypothetical protein